MSPLTGPNYDQNYSDYAFESDLPALEFSSGPPPFGNGMTASPCDVITGGSGCTLQPPTDDTVTPSGTSPLVGFYPWFSDDTHTAGECWWLIGQDVAGQTSNDFNNNVPDSQYGPPYNVPYQQTANPGSALLLAENFHSLGPDLGGFASPNACAASPAVVTPEAPAVPLIALAAGAVSAGAWALRCRKLRRAA
jgi:hypothetical protein